MAISKVLIASIFLSLLVLNGVQAIQTNEMTSKAVNTQKITVEVCVQEGVNYQEGRICAKEHVGPVVTGVSVCHLALMVTMRLALVMLRLLLVVTSPSALEYSI
ncbi:hypothetical protein CASFOL_042075 [Castilleja foliolosa]|uniref:Uncharacterized protein n=1 Tax=Castilleja foliolosa TaxID=1961234 RepID=A0ABD3B9G0_9LAMI